jgi:hypothetical protein
MAHYREMAGSSEKELRTLGAVAVGTLLLLAMNTRDEADLFCKYHQFLTKAVYVWPEIAPLIAKRFGGWPIASPLARQRGRWELELTLRAVR